MRQKTILLAAAFASALPALAQQSASFKLEESILNAGGTTLASANYHVKLDAIGDGVIGTGLASASFHADGSFVSAYTPPGETQSLVFSNKTTLRWSPEQSASHYEMYRDPLSTLSGGAFGTCFASSLTTNTTTDNTNPASGQGLFYLVTARNRLDEEGTKGFKSNGIERPNAAPCP